VELEAEFTPEHVLEAQLTTCLAVPRWVHEIMAGRPYADKAAMIAAADRAAATLTPDEVAGALAGHPRIGERGSALSQSEQSGVDSTAADEFVAANVAYEERFGRIYLVCASGRSGAELLADLRSRLDNDPETEIAVTARELRKIALLRLEKVLQ
jgi:2-oxo-4-hydroxy-4-carboxy-5-ureidoimidazoline decarboxylase